RSRRRDLGRAAGPSLGVGSAEARGDLVDRRPLGVADLLASLPVGVCDLVREVEDEAPVVLDFLRRRLAHEDSDRVTQVLQPGLPELLGRVVARVVALRPRRDDLVQELAVTVLLARLDVRLPDRERLAEGSAALGGGDDDAGARRPLEYEVPLLLREVGLARHGLSPFTCFCGLL